jgi:hypothetical protein
MSGETTLDTRLADLQRIVEVGFAQVDGKLAVFSERDRTAGIAEKAHSDAIKDLTDRLTAQDKRISRAAGIAIGVSGALSSASGLILWSLSHH